MSDPYCENCWGTDRLQYYNHVIGEIKNIRLCEECSWLPIKCVKRRVFTENDTAEDEDAIE